MHATPLESTVRRASASPRRRATVALDGPAIYDKQLRWKQHGQTKLDHLTLELLSQEDVACTFAPKINTRSSVHQVRKTSITSPAAEDVASDGGRSECSSSPYSASSPHTIHSIDSVDLRRASGNSNNHTPHEAVFPTESHEQSILLHLARQERARGDAQRAQHKLVTQPRKDFAKVTTAQPFELSVTNRKPRRSTSASPTQRAARTRSRTSSAIAPTSTINNSMSAGPQPLVKRRSLGSADDGSGGTVANNAAFTVEQAAPIGSPALAETFATQWQQERATLLSTIEMQRHELERRERAQEDAARLAETFAAAIEGFATRLETVERTTASELSEMKQLLAKQTAATDVLLHALGLTNAVVPPPPSSSPTPSSTTALRREIK